MRIKYNPQRSDNRLNYTFDGEVIHCIYIENGEKWRDTFDFSTLPNGKLTDLSTTLPINPIISAERVDGELKVELLYFHGADATHEERFPKWEVVE